jgi:predicted flavoprotein YhiN
LFYNRQKKRFEWERVKIIDNLLFAGEIIDLDGPTGGYNLQLCWSTGYLAGQSSSK